MENNKLNCNDYEKWCYLLKKKLPNLEVKFFVGNWIHASQLLFGPVLKVISYEPKLIDDVTLSHQFIHLIKRQ